MSNLKELFKINPIVAAVRSEKDFEIAVNTAVKVIFCLKANVMNISQIAKVAKEKNKTVLVHIDIAEGVGKDRKGVEFLKLNGIDGIITTRSSLVRIAKDCGLITVQRFFMMDSHSISTACDNISNSRPDMIEIMPGIMPKVISEMTSRHSLPVIAGGLIEEKEQIDSALKAGAIAISTGKETLWYE